MKFHLEIGDLLEAGVEDGKITFAPKSLVDRHIAEGLEDVRAGRTHGPYASAEDAFGANGEPRGASCKKALPVKLRFTEKADKG